MINIHNINLLAQTTAGCLWASTATRAPMAPSCTASARRALYLSLSIYIYIEREREKI